MTTTTRQISYRIEIIAYISQHLLKVSCAPRSLYCNTNIFLSPFLLFYTRKFKKKEKKKKKSAIYIHIVALQNTNYSSCPEQTTVFSYCNLQKDKIVG